MNQEEIKRLYIRLCSALTEYELNPDTGFPVEPHDAGEALYIAIQDIVNDMTNELF